jgi:hypothetical protein
VNMQNFYLVGSNICQQYTQDTFYNKTNNIHNFSSLLNITLHVSDGLSVHHQESKTVHTASGICHTDSVAAC